MWWGCSNCLTSHTVQELALRLELLSCNGPDKFLEAYPRPWASDASPDEKDEASSSKDEASGASPRKKRKHYTVGYSRL